MLYNTNIRYNGKEINFKVAKKWISGNYELPVFLRHVREWNQLHFEDPGYTPEMIEEYKQIESGAVPITQEFLKAFGELHRLPKKFAKLGILNAPESKNKIAERLYQLRTTRGNKTQLEVADLVNISRTAYAGYESGRSKPDIDTLIKIADLYGVALDYLVGRKY